MNGKNDEIPGARSSIPSSEQTAEAPTTRQTATDLSAPALISLSTPLEVTWKVGSFAAFSNQKVLNLETYKKSGEGVQTPVWFVEENGLLYFHTSRKTWKVKRIRNNPEVRVAPSTWGGQPKGDWLKGEARLVEEGDEADRILRLFDPKYGMMGRMIFFFERISGAKRLLFSIKLEEHS